MKRFLLSLVVLSFPVQAEDAGCFSNWASVTRKPTDWNGSITVSGGELLGLDDWRFDQQDKLVGKNDWQAATRYQAVQGRANNPRKPGMAKRAQQSLGPIAENGVFVRLRNVTNG